MEKSKEEVCDHEGGHGEGEGTERMTAQRSLEGHKENERREGEADHVVYESGGKSQGIRAHCRQGWVKSHWCERMAHGEETGASYVTLPSSFDLAVPFRYVRDVIPGASGRGEERGDLGLETDSDRGYMGVELGGGRRCVSG